MKVERRIKTVYIAADGKEFTSEEQCKNYEIENVAGVRYYHLRNVVDKLNRYKRGASWHSLRGLDGLVMNAKARLLEAAKGKRRHTKEFAETIAEAATNYLKHRGVYENALAHYRKLLAELKELDPKFDRKRKGGAV